MREMKDSGIEWIGEIPKDWKLIKIGNIYDERKIKVSDKDYEPLSVTKNGIVPQLESAAKSNDNDNRKLIKKNDFVINSRSDRRGSCGISNYDGSCSLINTVLKPRDYMINQYYNYVFRSELFADEFYKWGNGIVNDLWSTKWSSMKKIYIPFPNLTQQQSIANYLDDKCEKINQLIAKEQAEIDKLKEYRQSIITESVTKGLNPNTEMKDSGIEWIGEIPIGWDVIKLKYVCSNRREKYSDFCGSLDYFGLENIVSKTGEFINTENVYDLEQSQICKKNDVVFGKLRPYLAKVFIVEKDRCCSNEFAVFFDFLGDSRYFKYLFLSDWFIELVDASTYGAKMPRANIEYLKNMNITVPNKLEQKEIADYLDKKNQIVNHAIKKKLIKINRMIQFKKSLIYECVTGKKEV